MSIKPAPSAQVDIDKCLKQAKHIPDSEVKDQIVDVMRQIESVIEAHNLCPRTPFNAKEVLYLRIMVRRIMEKAKEADATGTVEFMEAVLNEVYDKFALEHFN